MNPFLDCTICQKPFADCKICQNHFADCKHVIFENITQENALSNVYYQKSVSKRISKLSFTEEQFWDLSFICKIQYKITSSNTLVWNLMLWQWLCLIQLKEWKLADLVKPKVLAKNNNFGDPYCWSKSMHKLHLIPTTHLLISSFYFLVGKFE